MLTIHKIDSDNYVLVTERLMLHGTLQHMIMELLALGLTVSQVTRMMMTLECGQHVDACLPIQQ